MKVRGFRLLLCAAMAVVLSAVLGGCFLLPEEEEALAPPLVEPEEIVYKTEPVTRGDMEYKVQVAAYFVPLVNHNLYFTKASGRIAGINVRLGQEVKAGDVLIELESDAVQKKIRDQQLVVKQLESKLSALKNQKPDEYAVQIARLDLEAARNALEDMKKERAEINEKYQINGSAAYADQIAELDKKIRDQNVQLEKLSLRLAQAQEFDNSYEIEQAAYALESAGNTLGDLQLEYENTVLRAPVDGRISWMRPSDIGENVGTYTTLITVADPTQLVLQFESSRASTLPVGLPVTIVYNDETYTGTVESNPSTNPLNQDGSRQEYARFTIDGFDYAKAASGASAQVTAILDSRKDVIVISKNRVNNYLTRYYVNVLVDGLKEERDIEIGLETPTQLEVVKGLQEGDLLIIQ